jgi:hypothetical protein
MTTWGWLSSAMRPSRSGRVRAEQRLPHHCAKGNRSRAPIRPATGKASRRKTCRCRLYGHSESARRLFGASPSATVFKNRRPRDVVATTMSARSPMGCSTKKRWPSSSMREMACASVSVHGTPFSIPPSDKIRRPVDADFLTQVTRTSSPSGGGVTLTKNGSIETATFAVFATFRRLFVVQSAFRR